MSTTRNSKRNAEWQGSGWIAKGLRQAIYNRDSRCCVYCGKAEGARFQVRGEVRKVRLSLDHVRPHVAGGSDLPSNLVAACLRCNSRRRDLTVAEWAAYLRAEGADTNGLCRRVRRALVKSFLYNGKPWTESE
mgnify:CR=1 FL=1